MPKRKMTTSYLVPPIPGGCSDRIAHFNYSVRKGSRRFLRQVMADAAANLAVLVFAGEFLCIRARIGVRRSVGVTFRGDGGHGDNRRFRQLPFQLVVLRFAFRKALAPAVIVNNDVDVVGVVERFGAAIKRGIVEVPLRRCELPDELVENVTVLVVSSAAALRREVELIPPL